MTSPIPQPSPAPERDAACWAQLATSRLTVGEMPREAVNLNVEGHRVFGPLQGFGPLWKKTFRIRLAGCPEVTPDEVVRVWKDEFPRFWPREQHFFASPRGIVPGEVALLNLRAGGLPLETGMLVLYADEESFTLMTPQGHMYASWITFSAYTDEESNADVEDAACTVAQVQMLLRAGDPVFALIMHFGGFRLEGGVWKHTLKALAARFNVDEEVHAEDVCLDPRLQWAYVSNIWYNAGMWTAFYTALAPLRWALGRIRRAGQRAPAGGDIAGVSSAMGEDARDG